MKRLVARIDSLVAEPADCQPRKCVWRLPDGYVTIRTYRDDHRDVFELWVRPNIDGKLRG